MPNNTTINESGVKLKDNSRYVNINNASSTIITSTKDKLHSDTPLISMWAKPSCGCRYKYTWYKHTFVDYCPHCHHYNCLRKNPKCVPEKEYTCGICGADYCGCCGKEKYSWSRYYLIRA